MNKTQTQASAMEDVWAQGHEDPVACFRRRLYEQRAHSIATDDAYLRTLRNDFERARSLQKRFGHLWARRTGSPTVFELIARACGETWDLEDEQKQRPGRRKSFSRYP